MQFGIGECNRLHLLIERMMASDAVQKFGNGKKRRPNVRSTRSQQHCLMFIIVSRVVGFDFVEIDSKQWKHETGVNWT